MKIGLDSIVLGDLVAGSHRYFTQLVAGLERFGDAHTYTVFANWRTLNTMSLPHQANWVYRPVQTRHWIPNALQQQCFTAWHSPDLLHSIGFVSPLRLDAPSVVTIFDLSFLRVPHTTTRVARLWWKTLGVCGIRRATRIIAISRNTQRDLIGCLGVSAHKISVVYPATSTLFSSVSDKAAIAAQYTLPARYVLFIGTLEPRKNIPTLLRAFALAKQRGALPHALVIAGQRGWLYQDIFRTVEELGLKDQVIFLGYVPDEDLPALYSGADLFAYLSWYEGFGFPVLEAMACGTPVLTSNVSALPEVVGDAGILVAPNDPEQTADAILRVLSDADWRRELSARGVARATFFSQERFVRGILQVYEEVLRS